MKLQDPEFERPAVGDREYYASLILLSATVVGALLLGLALWA